MLAAAKHKHETDSEYRKEFSKKVSAGLRLRFAISGSWWTGRKHSASAKAKMSATRRARCAIYGANNRGYKWLHNDVLKLSKSVNKDTSTQLLNDGWVFGRKKYGATSQLPMAASPKLAEV